MNWTEIVIKTNREAYDAISDMLLTLGSGGVAVQDPKDLLEEIQIIEGSGSLDEYIDENLLNEMNNMEDGMVILKSYFPESQNQVELIQIISEKLDDISKHLDTGNLELKHEIVKDEDWANNWKKHYNTFKISENVVIKPSWEQYDHKGPEIVIEMDPGMAFGTGTHETTKMCADMLEKYISKPDTIMDIGSGSGILTIIGAKLGAKKVIAMDIDKEAVKVTIDNCRHNDVLDKVEAFQGIIEDLEKTTKVDLIVANIIASVIINISAKILKHLKPGGIFIASGIIKSRKDEVLECYVKNKFECLEVVKNGEWVAIVFKCPDSL